MDVTVTIGLITRTFHTCENGETVMKVWAVIVRGHVVSVYTKERVALAMQETYRREGIVCEVTACTLNEEPDDVPE